MKKILLLLLITSTAAITQNNNTVSDSFNLTEADALFKKGTFQQALKIYQRIYKSSAKPNERFKAFYRICESNAFLYRYGTAASLLKNTPPPDNSDNRIRFLILKTELYRHFLMQYSSIQRRDVIDDEDERGDVFRRTKGEIKKEISDNYIKLWKQRRKLLGMNLQSEGYFLDIKDVDFGMYPTLFDYLVLKWTDYLFQYEVNDDTAPVAGILLVKNFNKKVNLNDPPALLAAELMETAGTLKKRGRIEARERWKIRRLLLPLKRSVYKIEDYKKYRVKSAGILLEWMKGFRSKEGKAEAGFEAAASFNYLQKYYDAVKLCEKIEKKYPKTNAARHAKKLRAQIEMPSLALKAETVRPPAVSAFALTTRNIKKVFFRVYKINPLTYKKEISDVNRYNRGWARLFRSVDKRIISDYLPSKEILLQWEVKTDDKGRYKYYTKTIDPPELKKGVYIALVAGDDSFKPGSSLLSACFLNVTDIVLVGTTGFTEKVRDAYFEYVYGKGKKSVDDEGVRFYAFDSLTGKPVDDADIDVYVTSRNSGYNAEHLYTKTNKNGVSSLSLPVSVKPDENTWYNFDPLAKKNGSYAYWSNQMYLSVNQPNVLDIFLQTDRPIYRPGQNVHVKAIVVRRTSNGFKTLNEKYSVDFRVYDPNNKEFFKKTVWLNSFGSAGVSFKIPTGRLLGNYGIHVTAASMHYYNSRSISFSVEEYKRPEFEVTLNPAKEPWKYDKPVKIKGKVRYYFGGAVPDAPVKYRIKRQVFIPWFYRYWFRDFSDNGSEIATGDIKTDADGNFVIPFTPPPPPRQRFYGRIPDIANYIVEVEARDAGGRTITSQQSFRASKNGVYLTIQPEKGFFLENDEMTISSKRMTVNDNPAPGKSQYEVFSLQDTDPKLGYGSRGYRGWTPPLDVQLKDVPNDTRVAAGEVSYDADGKSAVELKALKQGVYRIILKTNDLEGEEIKQEKIFVVAKDKKTAVPVKAASVTLVEKDEYSVGETVRILIGSALTDGIYQVEIWSGKGFVSAKLLQDSKQVKIIEVPVTEKLKGGFTLRWFGVKNSVIYHGQTRIAVPWKEKKLNISLTPFNKTLKPASKITWGIDLKNHKGKPVNGEALAVMYDRSLEYYAKTNPPWLDSLYIYSSTPQVSMDSLFMPYVRQFSITEGLLYRILKEFRRSPKEPRLPGIHSWGSWGGRGGYRMLSMAPLEEKEMDYDVSAPSVGRGQAAISAAIYGGDNTNAGVLRKSKKITRPAYEPVKTRKKFSETAFFYPHIITGKSGSKTFSFKTPDQLTSWRIKIFAFTKDVSEGKLTDDAVTKKDLMVRADIPRFFREKDRGTITAIVHNESDKPMAGTLSINITENKKNINKKLGLGKSRFEYNIKPHGQQSFSPEIKIPTGVSTYKIRVVARSGELSDAEERTLPILPSRERLIESALVSLDGKTRKNISIKLKPDPTRINESMVLQIEPQLALSILNTVPFLVDYPYECVEQILNKFVPLSIINEIYNNYPALKTAVKKIPKRKTLSPAWEKDDPNRLITLMETPWVWQSEGRPISWPVIDLLEPVTVKKQKEKTFRKLVAAQLPGGGFPWWQGGKDDPYMTLYVLAGLSEAQRYNVSVPDDIIKKALGYANKKIPLLLKPDERHLSIVSYAAYVLTSFPPDKYSEAKKGYRAARSWVKFLERNINALTPFGKAYLAYTYFRLGNSKRANRVMDMALDGAREDPIAGVYWTPEKYSWVWYSDSVEKHAFFLRMLLTLRPDDKRIPGMVRWLLFNRKGNVWKSTKASVAAMYSLLDVLKKRGALTHDETFKIEWGKTFDSIIVRADDFLEKPLRWQKKGMDITSDMNTAIIDKDGPGISFASMTWTYTTDALPEESARGMLNISRKFYLRVKEGKDYHLKPIKSGASISVGDQVEVQLKINTRSQFEYMHLKDPRPAGFEGETLLSGWKYDPLRFYEEPRDSLSNFFISWLPHGEYILRYRIRPTKAGVYRVGAATLQSMYSPDMTAHSSGFIFHVSN